MIGMVGRGHVYADAIWLMGDRMDTKLLVVWASGARHASARFITGCLDPFQGRDEQLAVARHIVNPMLNVFAATAPRRSKAEMEVLAAVPDVKTVHLSVGKLSVYEEFPDEVANIIREFLTSNSVD